MTQLRALNLQGADITEQDTEHFLVPFPELPRYFQLGKAHRMEQIYPQLRKQLNILMDQGPPLRGQWNYDATWLSGDPSKDVASASATLMPSIPADKIPPA